MNEAPSQYTVIIDENGNAIGPPRERSDRTNKKRVVEKSISVKVTPNADYTARQGREAWLELHSYPGCCVHWFNLWRKTMIPKNCGCVEDFDKILERYPPDFSSPDAFFVWGVYVHNRVNEKLIGEGDSTKKVIPIDEARVLWNRPAVAA